MQLAGGWFFPGAAEIIDPERCTVGEINNDKLGNMHTRLLTAVFH